MIDNYSVTYMMEKEYRIKRGKDKSMKVYIMPHWIDN
jgi:hypothetical protein